MKYKEDLQVKIFPGKELTKIIDFAETERNKDARFRNVWIIFDRDEVKNFDELINYSSRVYFISTTRFALCYEKTP